MYIFLEGGLKMFYREKCTLCGECLVKCHYLAYPEEKAKNEFKKLIEGEPTPVTSDCITCAACNMFCPESANPFDLINIRQEETGTFEITEQAQALIKMSTRMKSKVIEGEPEKSIMNLCVMGDLHPGIIEGQLFEGLTLLKGRNYFCRFGLMHAGTPSVVKDNAQTFVDNLTKTGAKEIICYHDDCYAMLANKVKEYGIDLPFKPIHIIEYLRDYVKEHENQIKNLNIKIAYQQPCASRYTFEKDTILDELFELIGAERVNRKYDRLGALCCGYSQGSMVNVSKEALVEWRMKNIMDAKDAGAEAMVFLCPVCVLYLRNRAKAQGLEPYIISNLVRLALGEELTHGGAGKIFE